MRLHVLGSSSAGNCYLLEAEDGNLVLEAGVRFEKITKLLPRLSTQDIQGVVVSHSHGDHARHLADFWHHGITAYAHADTLQELEEKGWIRRNIFYKPLEEHKTYAIGPWKVYPLPMKHDVRCLGYVVHHKEMGTLLFATDTVYVQQVVKGSNHLLIECNYSDKVLEENIATGRVSAAMRSRLMASHMELNQTLKCIRAHLSRDLRDVVLLHLSSNNSDAQAFQTAAEKASGVPTFTAASNTTIELL